MLFVAINVRGRESVGIFEALKNPTGLAALASIIFGGLSGVLVSSLYSRSAEKRQLTIGVINDYLEKYFELHDHCIGILNHPSSLAHDDNVNKIIKFGNWGDSVAVLVNRKLVDRKILEEFGLLGALTDFYSNVSTTKNTSKCQPEEWVNLSKL